MSTYTVRPTPINPVPVRGLGVRATVAARAEQEHLERQQANNAVILWWYLNRKKVTV